MISSSSSRRSSGFIMVGISHRFRTLAIHSYVVAQQSENAISAEASRCFSLRFCECIEDVTDKRTARTSGSWQAREIHSDYSPTQDMGSTSPFLSIPVQGSSLVQSAIDGWSRQAFQHFLYSPPHVMILHLCRFNFRGQHVRKLRHDP